MREPMRIAVYYPSRCRSDGAWAIFEEIQSEDTKRVVQTIVDEMRGATPCG